MRVGELTAVLVLTALTLGCTAPEDRAEHARAAARAALAQRDRAGALAAIEELRESAPDTPESLLEIAALLVQAGETPRVVWLLEAAVPRFPGREEIRLALARAALRVGDPSRARSAVADFSPASEHHPAALLLRAQAELALGELERGLAVLTEAERLYPERAEARLARVAALLRKGRHEEARGALEHARASLRGEVDAEMLRGFEVALAGIQAEQGEREAAISALHGMVREHPEDASAWRLLVRLLQEEGRAAEALGHVEAALEADPERLPLHALSASLYLALGRPEPAERALREIVERSSSLSAYVELARFHARQEGGERAAGVLREALDRFPDDPAARLFYAETLVALGRIDAARSELARLHEPFVDAPEAEYVRARLELAQGNAAEAAARLEQILPHLDRATTQFWLGRALEAQGDYAGARRRYGLARSRDPSWPPPALALVRLAQRRGDWASVVSEAQRVVRQRPGLFEGWAGLVDALARLGEGAAAEEAARSCREALPDHPGGPLLVARSLRARGQHRAALEELSRASERFGSRPMFQAERARTLALDGRLEAGIAVARDGLASDGDSALLHQALAELLFAQGAADEGARAVDRALELEPGDPTPLLRRCEFRAASGRLDAARSDCDRYLRARPDDPRAHFTLGAVHAAAGSSDEAIAAYRRAAALDEHAFAARNNLAELLAGRGDLDGALQAAQEAYAIAGDNPDVLDTLGWLYLRKGLVERSIALLELAHAAARDLPSAQYHLALAYREAGRTDEARDLLLDLQQPPESAGALHPRVEEALRSLP